MTEDNPLSFYLYFEHFVTLTCNSIIQHLCDLLNKGVLFYHTRLSIRDSVEVF